MPSKIFERKTLCSNLRQTSDFWNQSCIGFLKQKVKCSTVVCWFLSTLFPALNMMCSNLALVQFFFKGWSYSQTEKVRKKVRCLLAYRRERSCVKCASVAKNCCLSQELALHRKISNKNESQSGWWVLDLDSLCDWFTSWEVFESPGRLAHWWSDDQTGRWTR